MGREIDHPPQPKGATSAEKRAIDRFHRTVHAGDEAEVRAELEKALDLVVELIEQRRSRRGFDSAYDVPQDSD